ncbi:MAG: hypothetical protein AB7H96_16800 [Vicinamibacterales bacterium]
MTRSYPPDAVNSLRHGSRVHTGRLWFGLLAAPAAWVAQGALGWFFGERICTAMSVGTVRLVIGAVSIAALAIVGAALLTGWRSWQASTDRTGIEGWDRVTFMAMGGVLVSASFLVGTLWAGLSPMFIDACGGMR